MYQVFIERRVYRDLDRLSIADLRKIEARIIGLGDDPRPPGFKKLSGTTDLYRLRQGNYRLVYRIDDTKKIVNILLIRHRKDVYREL